MRVAFIIGGIAISPTGGYKVVFQYSNYLVAKGLDVTIYYESSKVGSKHKLVPGFIKRGIARKRVNIGPTWFNLDKRVQQRCIFKIDEDEVEDADVVIATAVDTALGVRNLSPKKGKKYYLIQGYETWDHDEEWVQSTYRYGMQNIVISHWLEGIVLGVTGIRPAYIPDGIDRSIFCPYKADGVREANTVSMLYHHAKYKGCRDAIAALMLAKEQIPGLRVKAFGVPKRPANLPDWFDYTQNATQEQLKQIYNSASAHICATVDEGFGLTGLEAMSCGCALVTTDYFGVREYADDTVALLSSIRDPEALAINLIRVLKDENLRKLISSAGIERSKKFDLTTSAQLFYELITTHRSL